LLEALPSVAREPISAAGSIQPNGGRLLSSPIMETNAGLSGQAVCCAAEKRDELAAFHSALKPTLPIGTALGDFSRSSVNEKAI
jgi:hypothetical protein